MLEKDSNARRKRVVILQPAQEYDINKEGKTETSVGGEGGGGGRLGLNGIKHLGIYRTRGT